MQRIAGDAEAGGNIFFAQKWIGRNPATQLRSKLPRLLHRSFRHQNYKFVAAVTRNHVRTAAIRFQNLSNALQHQVAFEVAIEIIYEFEPVKVHQHQRKGAACASRTLPFGGQRFHKEAVRFDAGEPVRDCLLLRLLERQCIVQRAGNQVGQRAEQKYLFICELDWFRRFHIQNAVQLFRVKHRQPNCRDRIGQQRFQRQFRVRRGVVGSHVAGSRHLPE